MGPVAGHAENPILPFGLGCVVITGKVYLGKQYMHVPASIHGFLKNDCGEI